MKYFTIILIFLIITACKKNTEEASLEETYEKEKAELNLTIEVENKTIETNTTQEANNTHQEPLKEIPLNLTKPSVKELTANKEKPLGFDFEIYYPKEGITVKGPLISLSLVMDRFSLSKPGNKNKWGEGYFLVSFNNDPIKHVMDKAAKTFRHLPSGENTVHVEMMQNDGTSYGVTKSVKFIVPDTGIAEEGSELYS